MKCSRLCIGFLIIGIGGALVAQSLGYVSQATLLSLLPFLACPIMCVAMMMFGKCGKGEDGECQDGTCKTASDTKPIAGKNA